MNASVNRQDELRAVLARRSRELGKTRAGIARDAGLSRTYLYALANGSARDPSVRTLVNLARALQVSPLLLFRHYADAAGAPMSGAPLLPTNRAVGLHAPGDVAVFNADLTMPDHALVLPGEAFRKVWEFQNMGEVPWRRRRLVRVDDDYVLARRTGDGLRAVLSPSLASLHREIEIPDTLPGHPVQIGVDFSAPNESCTVASIWRIEDAQSRPCYGPAFLCHVIVTVMAR
jgi:transcriptional regulator with XRE-family HTH domain